MKRISILIILLVLLSGGTLQAQFTSDKNLWTLIGNHLDSVALLSATAGDTTVSFYRTTDGDDTTTMVISGSLIIQSTNSGPLVSNSGIQSKNGSTTAGFLDLFEDSDDGTDRLRFIAQAMASDFTYTWPADDGTANQFLQSDGSGALVWTTTDLTTDITGTLPVANGGTGVADLDDIVGGTAITVTDGANTIIAGNATVAVTDQSITKTQIDSTGSNVVFDDAYRGTSAESDSAYATEFYARVVAGDSIATCLLLAGGTMAGDIDINDNDVIGADSLEVKEIVIPGATSGALKISVEDVVRGGWLSILANDTALAIVRDSTNDSTMLMCEGALSMTGVGYIKYIVDGSDPAWEEGILFWDNTNECLAYHSIYDGTTNQIGQELWTRVRNPPDSATLSDGQAVRIIGGAVMLPLIGLAKATTVDSAKCIGLVTIDEILGGTNGFVTTNGEVRGLKTNDIIGAADGEQLWLSADTAGAWVTTKPTIAVPIGYINNSHASNGVILVDRHHGPLQPEDIYRLDTASVGFSDSTGAAVGADIIMDTLGAPTFSTVQQMQNIFHSCGWISDGGFTDTTDGAGDIDSLYIAAGTGLIRSSDLAVDTNIILFFDWGDTTIAIPADTTLFIGVEYNAGIPRVFETTADKSLFDYQQNFELGTVTNEGGVLHITFNPHAIGDHATTMIERTQGTMGIQRDNDIGGLILGETGTRNPTVSDGVLFSKLNQFVISAIDLSSSGSMDRYYRAAGSGFTKEAAVTQWNNTQYDDGDGGLATIGNNKYAVQWFYIELDDVLISMYGRAEYNSLALAEGESPPSTLPSRLTVNQAKLIGRIIFQESAATASEIQTVFTTVFPATAAEDHGNLGGLPDDDHTQYLLRTDPADSALKVDTTGVVWNESAHTLLADSANKVDTTGVVWNEASHALVADSANKVDTTGIVWNEASHALLADSSDIAAILSGLGSGGRMYWVNDTVYVIDSTGESGLLRGYFNGSNQWVWQCDDGIVIDGGGGPLTTDRIVVDTITADTANINNLVANTSVNIADDLIPDSSINWPFEYVYLTNVHGFVGALSDSIFLYDHVQLGERGNPTGGDTLILLVDSAGNITPGDDDTVSVSGYVPYACTIDTIEVYYQVSSGSAIVDGFMKGPDLSSVTGLVDSTYESFAGDLTSTSWASVKYDITDIEATAGQRFAYKYIVNFAADDDRLRIGWVRMRVVR